MSEFLVMLKNANVPLVIVAKNKTMAIRKAYVIKKAYGIRQGIESVRLKPESK